MKKKPKPRKWLVVDGVTGRVLRTLVPSTKPKKAHAVQPPRKWLVIEKRTGKILTTIATHEWRDWYRARKQAEIELGRSRDEFELTKEEGS